MSGFKINNVDLDDILQMKTWFTTSGSTYTRILVLKLEVRYQK